MSRCSYQYPISFISDHEMSYNESMDAGEKENAESNKIAIFQSLQKMTIMYMIKMTEGIEGPFTIMYQADQ